MIRDESWVMTLNYWMLVGRYPNLKEEVGGSIPGCEISSLATWQKLGVGLSDICLKKIEIKFLKNVIEWQVLEGRRVGSGCCCFFSHVRYEPQFQVVNS